MGVTSLHFSKRDIFPVSWGARSVGGFGWLSKDAKCKGESEDCHERGTNLGDLG